MRHPAAALLATVVALAGALCGCATLPESGPIEDGTISGSAAQDNALNIDPRGPQPGDSAEEIVRGFLDAMQQTPIRTTVAREYLSHDAQDSWQPSETITYDQATPLTPPRGATQVTVTLTNAAQLDGRGAWVGAIPPNEPDGYSVPFDVVRQDGQWRIDDPPNALVVPETWFQERFLQVSLYFFDPTGSVLVPDPVFVPRGDQLASSLVHGLLQGPPTDLADHSVTQLPTDLRPAVSVPVSGGVADVQLTGDPGADPVPTGTAAQQMVAQLAWTLRQDPSIDRLRVSIDGQPVRLSGGVTEFPIEGEKYAPYVQGASTLLYGLVGGRMVGGSAQNLDPVTGPFGEAAAGLRDVVPDLLADRAVGVSSDGRSLLEASMRAGAGPPATVLTGAEDLLKPAWDFSGRIWAIDRQSTGAVVYYVQGDGAARTATVLKVPGISGRDVKAFLVSRDGTRLVAVVRRPHGDDIIVVSRVLAGADGRVDQALKATVVTEEDADPGLAIRDIAWQSPTSIAVLHPIAPSLFQVRSATVDGAPSGLNTLLLTINGDFSALAGTPSPGQSVYAVGKGRLIDLSPPRAGTVDIDENVVGLTYPG